VHKGGTRLAVVATHTQAQYGKRNYHEIRQQQIEQLIDYTKRLDPTRPVVLAGDFNTSPTGRYDGYIYDEMIAVWAELTKDARNDCLNDHNPVLVEPLACGTHYEGDRLSNEWIDYVFTRLGDNVQPVKLQLIRNEASDQPFSDHEGVDAELLVP
jgi:endonuclease/exonuclease/phosphatase family metal-dependent hydrolase